jgi:hypothetical protein
VPGTVLTSLVANGAFPNVTDVFSDLQLRDIPDINATGSAFYTYFWRTTIRPAALLRSTAAAADARSTSSSASASAPLVADPSPCGCGDAAMRLRLRGVNYRATVYLNGSEVQPERDADGASFPEAVGMFKRWSYLLPAALLHQTATKTSAAEDDDDDNDDDAAIDLAILVRPPDHIGVAGGGQGGKDHQMARNGPVMQYTAGWDWAQATPDRNTGLWDTVDIVQHGVGHGVGHVVGARQRAAQPARVALPQVALADPYVGTLYIIFSVAKYLH